MEQGLIKVSGVKTTKFAPDGQVHSSPCTQIWDCLTSMFTHLRCDAAEVLSQPSDPGQILTGKNITMPWAWQQCSVLQLLDSGVPVYPGCPNSVFFFHIHQLSIGCRSDLRQPHITADGTDGQRNHEESGDPTHQVWQLICFDENS